MPHRRPARKGSFGSHFDEMVRHFTPDPALARNRPPDTNPHELQEKRDIHALLFERAWPLDRGDRGEGAR